MVAGQPRRAAVHRRARAARRQPLPAVLAQRGTAACHPGEQAGDGQRGVRHDRRRGELARRHRRARPERGRRRQRARRRGDRTGGRRLLRRGGPGRDDHAGRPARARPGPPTRRPAHPGARRGGGRPARGRPVRRPAPRPARRAGRRRRVRVPVRPAVPDDGAAVPELLLPGGRDHRREPPQHAGRGRGGRLRLRRADHAVRHPAGVQAGLDHGHAAAGRGRRRRPRRDVQPGRLPGGRLLPVPGPAGPVDRGGHDLAGEHRRCLPRPGVRLLRPALQRALRARGRLVLRVHGVRRPVSRGGRGDRGRLPGRGGRLLAVVRAVVSAGAAAAAGSAGGGFPAGGGHQQAAVPRPRPSAAVPEWPVPVPAAPAPSAGP